MSAPLPNTFFKVRIKRPASIGFLQRWNTIIEAREIERSVARGKNKGYIALHKFICDRIHHLAIQVDIENGLINFCFLKEVQPFLNTRCCTTQPCSSET